MTHLCTCVNAYVCEDEMIAKMQHAGWSGERQDMEWGGGVHVGVRWAAGLEGWRGRGGEKSCVDPWSGVTDSPASW